MLAYILKRLIGMLVVLAIVMIVVFLLVRVAPGDPAAVMLGSDATPEDIARLRDQLGLNDSLPHQFLTFAAEVLRGDLGNSIFLGRPVLSAIAERAEPTLLLTLLSLLIACVIALPAGVVAAYRRGGLIDQLVSGIAMLLASIPNFWLGLLLIQLFAVGFGILPVSGYGLPGAGLSERLSHLVLPALTLGIVSSALIMRFTRASMLDVLSEDYVRTARAKGVSECRVVLRHALKNALIPILTVIGMTAAILVAGSVVIETVFGLPGVGNLVVNAVIRRDYPVIQGALLIVAALYVIINFMIDMLYLLIDPRVRY
jgi:peptide/nickel transport system permease protein